MDDLKSPHWFCSVLRVMRTGLTACFLWTLAGMVSGCYNPCKDLVCNHGECVSGECVCGDGWSGAFCADAHNSKFDGSYRVVEIADGGNRSYEMEIHPTLGKADQVSLIGLHQIPLLHVIGHIGSDGLQLTIPETHVAGGSISTTGTSTATADGKSLNIYYQFVADSSGIAEGCLASLSRN